jgi:hypothetical protein
MLRKEDFDRLRTEPKYIGMCDEQIESAVHRLNEVSTEALVGQLTERGFEVQLTAGRR